MRLHSAWLMHCRRLAGHGPDLVSLHCWVALRWDTRMVDCAAPYPLPSAVPCAACSLYASLGWNEARAWVDAAWVKDAEKGKLTSRPRRLLYVKTLPCSPEAVVQKCGGGAAPAMEASDSTAEASGDAAAAV